MWVYTRTNEVELGGNWQNCERFLAARGNILTLIVIGDYVSERDKETRLFGKWVVYTDSFVVDFINI